MEQGPKPVRKPELLKCDTCKLRFASLEQLQKHRKDPRYHLFCSQCSAEFHTDEGLKRHTLQIHTTEQKLSCTACSKVFARLSGLIGHIESKECKAISGDQFTNAVQERMAEDTSSLTLTNYIKYGQTSAGHNAKLGASANISTASNQPPKPLALGPKYPDIGTLSLYGKDEKVLSRAATTSNAQTSAVTFRSSTSPVEAKSPFDPASPRFNASAYYVDLIKRYKCPHQRCMQVDQLDINKSLIVISKSFDSKRGFITHLSSAHVLKEKLKCSSCGRLFINVTALTQHCENELSKCRIRDNASYAVDVAAFTAGIAAVAGRNADRSVRYVNNLPLALSRERATVATHEAAQAEEENQYGYSEHNRPAW